MDPQTLACYNNFAKEFAGKYNAAGSGISTYFSRAFPQTQSRILDVGCGSGKGLAYLLQLGYDAYGAEPAEELRKEAEKEYPQLAGRLFSFGLPFSQPPIVNNLDGIVCSAVIMHIPLSQQQASLKDLFSMLRPNGRLLISFSSSRPGLDEESRDDRGRLFVNLSPSRFGESLKNPGFALLETFDNHDSLGRSEITWFSYLAERPFQK